MFPGHTDVAPVMLPVAFGRLAVTKTDAVSEHPVTLLVTLTTYRVFCVMPVMSGLEMVVLFKNVAGLQEYE